MHNSRHLRELLRRANRDPLYRQRRDPHRTVMADPSAEVEADEFALARRWRLDVRLPEPVAAVVRDDLTDFLKHLGVTVGTKAGTPGLTVRIGKDLAPRDCRLAFAPEAILVQGGDTAGVWAGIAWLEREMRVRRGAILPRTTITRRAAWRVQISQGPWGGNYSVPDFSPEFLGDDSFRLYAHYGVNSMMIYGDLLCYADSRILPELNHPDAAGHLALLQEAARRAARYGIRFTWVPVGPKLRPDHPVFEAHPGVRGAGLEREPRLHFLCSSHPKVLAFCEETIGNVFRQVPELAGTVLITWSESFYHCAMWADRRGHQPCPACNALPRDTMVAGLVGAVDRGVRRGAPDAFTAMWVYTWPHGDRRAAFRALDPAVGVFHALDKDEPHHKSSYTKSIWDYSLDYRGPTRAMQDLARFAHRQRRSLFVKTETGVGLEVFQFPYVPALPHLAGKWERVRALRPAGGHQSWLFFGMCGSRAEELGLWAAYAPELTASEFLRGMAARDFGRAGPAVAQAWDALGEAVRHLPALMLGNYYVGPTFLGPCHPLVTDPHAPIAEVFHAYLFYLQELEETFSVKPIEQTRTCLVLTELPASSRDIGVVPDDPARDGWDIVASEYATAAREARLACQCLQAARPGLRTDADRLNWAEEQTLTELIYRTFLASAHAVQFLQARREWEQTGAPRARARLRRLAAADRANAAAARPLYQRAPWLDYAHRLDGKFAPAAAMIAEKVRMLDVWLAAGARETAV